MHSMGTTGLTKTKSNQGVCAKCYTNWREETKDEIKDEGRLKKLKKLMDVKEELLHVLVKRRAQIARMQVG